MSRISKTPGPFGTPPGEIWVDTPDGVMKTYEDGTTRHSLYDATMVTNYESQAFGHGAFPGDDDSRMIPMGYDERDSLGTVTGASSKEPLGRQR